MLLDLRETVRNSKPIKYTLIGLICVPFALVGIGSYFAGQNATPVATVNGEPIDEQALEAAYRQQRQRFAQMFGGQIPEAFDDETLLRRQALDQLVSQRVLVDEVAAQRFAVGDETLGRAIRERPEFQTDGRFDAERYRQLLGGSSSNQVAAFEAQYRDETALEQFQAGVVQTSFLLPGEALRLDSLKRQQRVIDAVRFELAALETGMEIEDEAVQARFDENADSYSFPPRAKVAWIELSATQLADSMDVSEDDAKDWYEANRTRFVTPESREASHILFAVDDVGDEDEMAEALAGAQAAAQRLQAGESFADLATELSDDPGSAGNGGSLGVISPGLMVPAFEQALEALDVQGSVSEPVTSEFGVHLIRLDKLVPESGLGFDDVREEALTAARRDRADREFFELREQLAELAFDNPESLQPAADETGLEIFSSDWVERGMPTDDAAPVLSNPVVLDTVFSADVLDDGNNSEPVEIGDRHVVVLRVTDDEGPRPKTIDDVRDDIVAELKRERAGALVDERAAVAQEALADGATPASLVKDEAGVTMLEGEQLERGSAALDPATLAVLFAAPVPDESNPSIGTAILDNGDRLAWRLVSVSTPELASDTTPVASGGDTEPPLAVVPSGADPRLGSVEFAALVASLRARADVDLEP